MVSRAPLVVARYHLRLHGVKVSNCKEGPGRVAECDP